LQVDEEMSIGIEMLYPNRQNLVKKCSEKFDNFLANKTIFKIKVYPLFYNRPHTEHFLG
jgi:hypothetical protein